MKNIFFALLVLCTATLACGGSAQLEMTPEAYFNEYGGNIEVYRTIFSLTNCSELQTQFDLAADHNDIAEPGSPARKWTLGYMNAADSQMREIGCYEQ